MLDEMLQAIDRHDLVTKLTVAAKARKQAHAHPMEADERAEWQRVYMGLIEDYYAAATRATQDCLRPWDETWARLLCETWADRDGDDGIIEHVAKIALYDGEALHAYIYGE